MVEPDTVPKDDMVLLQFPDLHGSLRGILIDDEDWERAVEEGYGFGAPIIDWHATRNESNILDEPRFGPSDGDLIAVADAETRAEMTWNDHSKRALCNLEWPNGDPFDFCSRTALASVLNSSRYKGIVGAEIEFNLMRESNKHGVDGSSGITTFGDLYDSKIMDAYGTYFSQLNRAMKGLGHKLGGLHHESSPGQLEAIIYHSEALQQADAVVSLRTAIRGLARHHDLEPIMMPRPISGKDGNSQHYHLSLWEGGENIFADDSDELGLSNLAYHFLGGVLEHAHGLTALCAPTINSYKRLQPGLWAPVTPSYGPDNRSCAVRVPPESGEATRLELRFPDNAANPYLALAGTFAAGFWGIDSKIDPGDPTTKNLYDGEIEDHLPTSLTEALEELRDDSLLVKTLGEPLIDRFVALKENEIGRYNDTITDWEVKEYADRL